MLRDDNYCGDVCRVPKVVFKQRGADRLISRAKKSDHVLVLEWGWGRLAAALRGAKLY
jgi:hypothetical protein